MSVQSAFAFLKHAREPDPDLAAQIRDLGPEADLDSLVQTGVQTGYTFTAGDLRTAFNTDWAMRWLHARSRRKG